jgi:hypothetical protein
MIRNRRFDKQKTDISDMGQDLIKIKNDMIT